MSSEFLSQQALLLLKKCEQKIELIKRQIGIAIETGSLSESRSRKTRHIRLDAMGAGAMERSGEKRLFVQRLKQCAAVGDVK